MGDAASVPLAALLDAGAVLLDESVADREAAVRRVGDALVAAGAADPVYVDAMLDRERAVSTFVGDGIALPHGGLAGAASVRHDALALLRVPEPIDWDGQRVDLVIGIAATGNGYIALLSRLALVLLDPDAARAIRAATTPDAVRAVLDRERD